METPSPCPGRVNQCTLRTLARATIPLGLSYSFLHLHHYLHRHQRRRGQPLLSLSLSPFLATAAALSSSPQKGELEGVGDVRLLHYVFLTEPPLTSTPSSPHLDSSSFRRSFSLSPPVPRSFSMPATFPRFSSDRERILPVAEVFFFLARTDVPFNHPTRRRWQKGRYRHRINFLCSWARGRPFVTK